MYVEIDINTRPVTTPGTAPPMNRSRMDTDATTPRRIMGMLGGMMIPIVEAVALIAAA